MSVRRVLVDCVVLSLKDACVFYPCCKGCFSRIDVEQQDTTRCRCSKCGSSCLREQVDYRYRLSLRVARDRCIFGVTVFGTCLNPFFGINASGLQRLVENFDGASTRSTLLVKAVEDCFIGGHFIFGIKVSKTESGPWLGGPAVNGSSSKEAVHFIATQMILPKAAGLGGCTVVSYYRILLQKAAEYELESTDPSKTSRPPATTLLLIPRRFQASSFNNATLSASGLLSQSPQSSQNQDGTLTPTPPWQQSLGLVTSSAEQEEGYSTQDSGDENRRQTDNYKTPHHAQRAYLENHQVTEERAMSPLLSLECSSSSSPRFTKCPFSSIEKAVGNTPTLNTWFSPPSPGHNSSKGFSTRQLTKAFLSSSLVWEDLPFSESLTAFLCEENKGFDIVGETESHLNVQSQEETKRTNLEIGKQDKNISHKSTSVCQSNTQLTDSHSQLLLDITNTSASNGYDFSDQVHKNPNGFASMSQAKNMWSNECYQKDEKASSRSFENEEKEQLEGDTYNCSADLFSGSLIIDMNTDQLNTHAETFRTATEACPLLPELNKQHLRSKNGTPSTPDKQKWKRYKCIKRDSLIPSGTQELDFIPSSQSTPIVKVAVVKGPPVSSYRTGNLPQLDGKKTARTTSSLCKLNCVSANQLIQCGRVSTNENMMWTSWKPDKHKNHLLAQQHLMVQRGALNSESTGKTNHKCDSSDCDVTVYDYEDDALIVPPTPAAKTQLSGKIRRRRRQTNTSSRTLGYSCEEQQGDGVDCKRNRLNNTLTSSRRGLAAHTGNCESETVNEGSLVRSNCYLLDDDNEACDWSRDLFSDSV
ncbi:DNA damage-induced apoptosis suppressor protein isoform X1 [Etheostoma cragini]|uniref:DNA damage-induced apoptosis suppressor protein isoform X1 n=1 Tax=Etheostoma cragini TaxID=417921 RepID=UPI00155E0BC0|nr:DNA damage-induced apoptosis suppressor protein isoform X1 [Etheostoma cragini]